MKNIEQGRAGGNQWGAAAQTTGEKLLLTVEEVAGLTALPVHFWTFVAANEHDWEITRFFFAAGHWRITPFALADYLNEDLGVYYGVYEDFQEESRPARIAAGNG